MGTSKEISNTISKKGKFRHLARNIYLGFRAQTVLKKLADSLKEQDLSNDLYSIIWPSLKGRLYMSAHKKTLSVVVVVCNLL